MEKSCGLETGTQLVIDTSCVPVSAPIGAIVTDDPVRPRRHRQGLTPRDPKNCARTLAQSVDSWRGARFRFLDDVGPDGMALVLAPLAAPELVPDQGGAAAAAELVKPDSSTWCGPSSLCQTSLKGGCRQIKD
ncbi:MAG: hypothetical protein JO114_18520 [Planctomycetaceae bacterium]|nr:hypothetical protein [Planctomycetaceae bacterium]